MVTITVRPILRYSPSSFLWEKRPELSFPTNLTPFSLAALLALPSSKEGLAEVSILNVLAMPVSADHLPFTYLPFHTNGKTGQPHVMRQPVALLAQPALLSAHLTKAGF
jgi:hypothetical protein